MTGLPRDKPTVLLVRDGKDARRWSFSDIGPVLGEKYKLVKDAAQLGGELGDAPWAYRDQSVAAHIGMSEQRWSNARKGRARAEHSDYVLATHLRELAHYFHLDAAHYLGEDAWRFYTPDFTTDQLEKRLIDVGYYRTSRFDAQGELRPADRLLSWWRDRHGMTRQGIAVSLAREVDRAEEPTRATGVVDEFMEEEESAAALFHGRDRIALRLSVDTGWHLVLLQLTDAVGPPHYTLRCLLPSYRQRATVLETSLPVPATPDQQGRPGFGLGADPGLVDFIAIVTKGRPLDLPFHTPDQGRFHVIAPGDELQQVETALHAVPVDSRRVLHAPLRIIV